MIRVRHRTGGRPPAVDDEIHEPITGDAVAMIAGPNSARIVMYSDLHKYQSLEDLFGGYPAVALLIERQAGKGHWVAVIDHGEWVEYFDSLAPKERRGRERGAPDVELRWTSPALRPRLHENYPYLTRLLYDDGRPVVWNSVGLQNDSKRDGAQTCGRFVGARIALRDMPLRQFQEMFAESPDPDSLVAELTSSVPSHPE